MTERYECPLCSKTYSGRTDLRVHLEVEHRKSEIVSCLVDATAAHDERREVDETTASSDEPPTPSV